MWEAEKWEKLFVDNVIMQSFAIGLVWGVYGKSVKNLPQVAKSDDEQKATDAREQFKLLKKQLKTVVTNQKTRLEAALSQNRMWEAEKWEKLFVDNVIMQSFAIGLVWGVY
ncbi:hypothetical protein CK486_17800, partial [Pseudomonas sp. HAR-UPW-AIA-41]